MLRICAQPLITHAAVPGGRVSCPPPRPHVAPTTHAGCLRCSLLPGKAVGAAACASRSWRQQLKDEVLWKELCRQEWGLDVALWPNGGIHNSFRQVCSMFFPPCIHSCPYMTGFRGTVCVCGIPLVRKCTAILAHGTYCRETYLEWQRHFPRYGRLAPRACRVCTTLYSWYQRHLPEVAASFR